MMGSRPAKHWPFLLGVPLLAATPAEAHLVSSGLGPAYDGAWHLLLSPDELLAIAALALLAGLRGPTAARAVFFALPPAWVAGAVLGPAPGASLQAVLVAVSLLGLGGLLAAELAVPVWSFVVFGLLLGLWHGGADALPLLPSFGAAIVTGILVALVASLALPLRSLWSRTIPRVAGSWIAALGLLLVGWRLHAG